MKTLGKSLIILIVVMVIIFAISFAWVWTGNPHEQVTFGMILMLAADITAWVIRVGVVLVIIWCLFGAL